MDRNKQPWSKLDKSRYCPFLPQLVMYRSTGWRPGWIWYSKLVLLIEQKYVGGISRKLVLVVMIRKGPWASLWCPWRVPAGSSNAPRSQQLLCAYLTIPNPPAHQYCCLPVKTSMKLKVFMFSSKLLHRVTSDQICEHKRLLNFLHLFFSWVAICWYIPCYTNQMAKFSNTFICL